MRARLIVETPLRVGGREQQVTKLEFVSLGGRLHVISPARLGELLLRDSERTLSDWSDEVLRRGGEANLTGFLRNRGLLSREAVEAAARYSVSSEHERVNEFQPHARDGHGRLVLPGSAIKGAIRAAVLHALSSREEVNRYVEGKREGKSRFYARELDRKILQSYELPGRELRPGPHFDLMRAVKVSDAYGDLRSHVEKVMVQSYAGHGGRRRATLGASDTIYAECLQPGSRAEFDLKVDQNILHTFRRARHLPFEDEGSLLQLVRDFYGEVWGFDRRYYGLAGAQESANAPDMPAGPPSFEEWLRQEKGVENDVLTHKTRKPYQAEYRRTFDLFETNETGRQRESSASETGYEGVADSPEGNLGRIREFYSGSPPGFRLGWGSGLMSTTVDMNLKPENLGKILRIISSRHHTGEPADGPRSRKLVQAGREPRSPMGWASLEEV